MATVTTTHEINDAVFYVNGVEGSITPCTVCKVTISIYTDVETDIVKTVIVYDTITEDNMKSFYRIPEEHIYSDKDGALTALGNLI